MNDRRPDDTNRPADDAARARELRGVTRLLDERGARERSRLGHDAIERIFVASAQKLADGQQHAEELPAPLPFPLRRAGASASQGLVFRLAAAIAVIVGLGAVVTVAVLTSRPDEREGTTLVEAPEVTAPSPAAAPDRSTEQSPRRIARTDASDHFDAALEGALAASTASRSAGAVIVALADNSAGALAGFAGSGDGAYEALAVEMEPLFATGALLDGGESAYDDLSAELAAVAMRAGAVPSSTTQPASSAGQMQTQPRS